MHEDPHVSQKSEEDRERDRRFQEEARILNKLAREHTDEILTAEDWKRFGLDEVNPQAVEDFGWAIYVAEHEGNKSVGVQIFDDRGVRDIREFRAFDNTLPLSTRQQEVEEAIEERSRAHREERERAKKERREQAERERGFPEGKYMLYVTYPHQREGTKTIPIHEVTVETETTREDAFQYARSWIQTFGIHNYSLDFSKISKETGGAPIRAVLKKDNVEVPFDCLVDASGYIVKPKE